MGKNSLIKSTEKKKAKLKKKETAAKKAATPKNTSATKKPTKKAPSASKTSDTKNIKKTPAKKSTSKPTAKELILKKFEPLSGQPAPLAISGRKKNIPSAPNLIVSKDPQEIQRLRTLLLKQFSMDEIKTAAKAPQPEKPNQTQPGNKPIKAAEPGPSVSSTYTANDGPSYDTIQSEPDPLKRMLKYAGIGFIVLILLIVGASYKNSSKYYLETKADALEIWRGQFSPTGKECLILLHGVTAPQDSDAVYTRNHVFPLAFNYFLDKADALLDNQEAPDYESIKAYLLKAETFAINPDMKNGISSRVNSINLMTLMYKINVAMHKGTAESLEKAAKLTQEAGKLTADATQSQLLAQKAAEIKNQQKALTATEAEAVSRQNAESTTEGEPTPSKKD